MGTLITIGIIIYYIYGFFSGKDEDKAPTPTTQKQKQKPQPRPQVVMEQSDRHIAEEAESREPEEANKTHFDELQEVLRQMEEQKKQKERQRKKGKQTKPMTLAEQAEQRKREEGLTAASNMAVKPMASGNEGERVTTNERVMSVGQEVSCGLTPEDLRRAVILDAIFKRPEF